MSVRLVHCAKLGKEATGLDTPPFEGELGQSIFNHISAEAWNIWEDDVMIKVINEYRLNLADKKDYETLIKQMQEFLNLS